MHFIYIIIILKMSRKTGNTFGTEDDKTNCPFYFKIGACRHGDKCTRVHNKPTSSDTIIIKNMYLNTPTEIAIAEGKKVSEEDIVEANKAFETFYEEVFLKFAEFGKLEELNVCDNLGDHLIGNVIARFSTDEQATKALSSLSNKFYNNRPIYIEFSPVTDFRESICKQNDKSSCDRGAFCNFLHLKYISKRFKDSLFDQMFYEHPEYLKRTTEYRRKRRRDRSNSSNRSDLVSCSSKERIKIIDKWDKEFEQEKVDNEKNIKFATDAISEAYNLIVSKNK